MRIRKLGIQNVLHFDDFELDFGQSEKGLHVIYGPNEAGKSTILRVLVDLLFGGKIDDDFKDGYGSKSRIDGILEAGYQDLPDEVAAGEASVAGLPTGDVAKSDIPTAGDQEGAALGGPIPGSVAAPLSSPVQLTIARKKRYSNLILTDDGQDELPEEVILSLLGGLDKERYTLLFGFNHDRLRLGGDSLLESGGHAGISLFEAGGGIQFLQQILGDLSTKADGLLDASFRSNSRKNLNIAWRLYKELKENARKSSLKSDDWHRLKNEIDVKKDFIDSLRRELGELESRTHQLQRIARTRPFVTDLSEVTKRIDGMADSIELTPEMDNQIRTDVTSLEQAEGEIRKKEQELSGATQALEAIVVNEAVLEAAGPINALNRKIEQYLEANRSLPGLRHQVESEESRARELAHDLAPAIDFAEVEKLWIPTKDDLLLRDLAVKWVDVKRELKLASDEVTKLDEDIRYRREELGKLGQTPDLTYLRQTLEEVQKAGDIESTLTELKREVGNKNKAAKQQLQGQTIWNGEPQALVQLPVPLAQTVSRYADRFSEAEARITEVQREISKRLDEQESIDEQIATLELSGKVPSESDLAVARAHRDKGWHLVRAAWLGDSGSPSEEEAVLWSSEGKALPEAFEEAMSEADNVADWMRRESDRSARLSQLQLQRERLEKKLSQLATQLDEAKLASEALQNEWEDEWSTSGISPKSPSEMKAWLADYYREVCKYMADIQILEDRIRDLTELRDSLKSRLETAYARARQIQAVDTVEAGQVSHETTATQTSAESYQISLIPDLESQSPELQVRAGLTFTSLRELVSAVSNWMNEVDGVDKLRKSLLQQYGEFKSKREKEAALGRQKKDDFAAIKREWTGFTATYPFLPENPQVVVRYLDRLRELFDIHREIVRLRSDALNAKAICSSFEEEVKSLSLQIDKTIEEPVSYSAFVEQLSRELTEAGQQDRERRLLSQQVSKLMGELERLVSDKSELQAIVSGYQMRYQCRDNEALRLLVSQSEEKKGLRSRLDEIESSLRHVGDGFGVAELVLEVEAAPAVDTLQTLTEEAEASYQEKLAIRQAEEKALWELTQQFTAMNEDKSDAADLAQQAEFRLAEVDRYWNEYLRFELAKRLLQRAIEEFREQNESTVIDRASELFRELTLGHYQELTVEYEGVEPVLEAITRDNERRRVGQMSDGTRDQLYLALRLAFVEQHLLSADAVPLIMDDILVHFDDARTHATLQLLGRLAEKTQIFYFTHHQSIVEAATSIAGTGEVGVMVHQLGGPVA